MTIENTPEARIQEILVSQRKYFRTGATLSVKFRKEQLRKLAQAIEKFEKPLADALWTDLHKSFQEAYLTEIGLVKAEIKEHLPDNLFNWQLMEGDSIVCEYLCI